ncbi:chaperone protein DnaK-like [Paramacrobiotus metropolitanus]|uniref:chaperone protein DnaK-like n=1 Tax=Paramacrobiotus metropolitanus TaxID=2943436 RepID=UPI0024463D89|nr:chaperone protein DnaK-like [Paramacrobiotus metropolitanus]
METQRQATLNAARQAGFRNVSLLNEPTAAAIAYGGVIDQQCTVMVFDFGGGTLDITIMKVEGREEYRMLTTDGNMYLGGEDFDNEIVQYFLEDIEKKTGHNLSEDNKARALLKLVAEQAKIALSNDIPRYHETVYSLEALFGIQYEAELTKETFQGMFQGLLKKILEPVKGALEATQLTVKDIDRVILVGGSSKLPAVKSTLEKFFGRSNVVCADANPDEAIAHGAAIQSYRLNNGQPSNFQEVTAYPYGIEVLHRNWLWRTTRIAELIPRGQPYPYKTTECFETAYDNQTAVTFQIYQSKRGFHVDKFRIGLFTIPNLPKRMKGECQFELTYDIDRNNILHATTQGRNNIADYKKNLDIQLDNIA